MRKIFLFGVVLSAFLWACNGAQEDPATTEGEIDLSEVEAEPETTETKGYILPSPFELASLIMRSGATYDEAILNPASRSSDYTDNYRKGLNLGIYGADLGYALMYDKPQVGVNYLNVCTEMANDIGVIGAFESATISRIENNIDNRDSLIRIATQNFGQVDMYLKENDRMSTSALVLAGGWIEALYIAVQISKQGEHDAIMERVGEQKLSLELLIEHLAKFRTEEGFGELIEDLIELKNRYNMVKMSYDYKEATTDTASKTLVINSTSTIEITEEAFVAISEQVTTIRNKIIE
jgi:hypothetical protein